MNAEVPDHIPDDIDQTNPFAPPGGPSQKPFGIGYDPRTGLVVVRIGEGKNMQQAGLPVPQALLAIYSMLGKCLQALMKPPPGAGSDEGPRIVTPDEF